MRRLLNLDNDNAMKWLGYYYAWGEGIEHDYAKAMEWYKKAAELGDASSMHSIGYMYANGEGVEQDWNKALEWMEKAVEADPYDEQYKEDLEHVKSMLQ